MKFEDIIQSLANQTEYKKLRDLKARIKDGDMYSSLINSSQAIILSINSIKEVITNQEYQPLQKLMAVRV